VLRGCTVGERLHTVRWMAAYYVGTERNTSVPVGCRLKRLAGRLGEFHLLVDSEAELKLLQRSPVTEDKTWSVFIEVDCGYGRGLTTTRE